MRDAAPSFAAEFSEEPPLPHSPIGNIQPMQSPAFRSHLAVASWGQWFSGKRLLATMVLIWVGVAVICIPMAFVTAFSSAEKVRGADMWIIRTSGGLAVEYTTAELMTSGIFGAFFMVLGWTCFFFVATMVIAALKVLATPSR